MSKYLHHSGYFLPGNHTRRMPNWNSTGYLCFFSQLVSVWPGHCVNNGQSKLTTGIFRETSRRGPVRGRNESTVASAFGEVAGKNCWAPHRKRRQETRLRAYGRSRVAE